MRRIRRGMTLIELLVAVIVIGIVVAFGVNQAFRPGTMAAEQLGIARINTAVEYALAEAIRRPSSTVTLQVGAADVRVLRDGTELPQYRQLLPGGITATAVTLTAQGDGTFTGSGATTLSSPDFSYALTIDRAGRIAR